MNRHKIITYSGLGVVCLGALLYPGFKPLASKNSSNAKVSSVEKAVDEGPEREGHYGGKNRDQEKIRSYGSRRERRSERRKNREELSSMFIKFGEELGSLKYFTFPDEDQNIKYQAIVESLGEKYKWFGERHMELGKDKLIDKKRKGRKREGKRAHMHGKRHKHSGETHVHRKNPHKKIRPR